MNDITNLSLNPLPLIGGVAVPVKSTKAKYIALGFGALCFISLIIYYSNKNNTDERKV